MHMNKTFDLLLTVGLLLTTGIGSAAPFCPESVRMASVLSDSFDKDEAPVASPTPDASTPGYDFHTFDRSLRETLRFPEERFREGEEIRLRLDFILGDDHWVTAVAVRKSSGDEALDNEIRKRLTESSVWSDKISPGSKNLSVKWRLVRDTDGTLRATDANIYSLVDSMPRFEGEGALRLRAWLRQEIGKVSEPATLEWSFVVEKDGTISGVQFGEDCPKWLSERMTAVLPRLPHFTPAVYYGETVRVRLGDVMAFGKEVGTPEQLRPVLREKTDKSLEKIAAAERARSQQKPSAMAVKGVQDPEFQGGGLQTFRAWVIRSVRYPNGMSQIGQTGRVTVSFVVDRRGEVTHLTTKKSSHKLFERAVLRTMEHSPRWQPATCQGWLVKARYTLPIHFSLSH